MPSECTLCYRKELIREKSLKGTLDFPPVIGFIGLGDQRLPMATAIAEGGYALHVWALHPKSLDVLGDVPHVRHPNTRDLGAVCDIVCLCVSADKDVMQVVAGGLLDGLRPGSVVVNHGTGTPGNAAQLTEICTPVKVDVLDAPVSGGRLAAEKRALTTMVGGLQPVAERCAPLFRSFSQHVVYMGDTGSGQTAKLFNNTLLMMNQANIAELIELAVSFGTDPSRLVDVLMLGSASSQALTLLNTMVTVDTVDHLSKVEAEDMQIFANAMSERGLKADSATERGLAGAHGLTALLHRLNP